MHGIIPIAIQLSFALTTMFNKIRCAAATICILLAACGGGTSGGGIPLSGPTSHPGLWEFLASITIVVEGSTQTLEHKTVVNVAVNGITTIRETDSECAVSVFVNGEALNYHEDCTVTTSNGPCVVELRSTGTFFGNHVSSNFGPRSYICTGVPVSFSGNLVGKKI